MVAGAVVRKLRRPRDGETLLVFQKYYCTGNGSAGGVDQVQDKILFKRTFWTIYDFRNFNHIITETPGVVFVWIALDDDIIL